MSVPLILLILAVISFALAAFRVKASVDFLPLGLALVAASWVAAAL